jgi:hypothetical protein
MHDTEEGTSANCRASRQPLEGSHWAVEPTISNRIDRFEPVITFVMLIELVTLTANHRLCCCQFHDW